MAAARGRRVNSLQAPRRPPDDAAATEQRQAPAMPADATGNKIPAGEAKCIKRTAHLRHVADGRITTCTGSPSTRNRSVHGAD